MGGNPHLTNVRFSQIGATWLNSNFLMLICLTCFSGRSSANKPLACFGLSPPNQAQRFTPMTKGGTTIPNGLSISPFVLRPTKLAFTNQARLVRAFCLPVLTFVRTGFLFCYIFFPARRDAPVPDAGVVLGNVTFLRRDGFWRILLCYVFACTSSRCGGSPNNCYGNAGFVTEMGVLLRSQCET